MIKQFYLTHMWTLKGTTTPSQSGHESNGNKWVLYFPQCSWTGASPSGGFVSYPGHSLCVCVCVGGGLTLCKNAVSVFYNHSQLGCI